MNPLSLCLLLSCVLNVWAELQCGPTEVNRVNICCDKCPPGKTPIVTYFKIKIGFTVSMKQFYYLLVFIEVKNYISVYTYIFHVLM